MIFRSSKVFLFIISLFVFTASCHQSETQSTTEQNPGSYSPEPTTSPRGNETTTSGEIYISVDESLQPVIRAEAETFEALYPNATIHPIYMPGEEAIEAMLVSDSIRLAVVTRKLKRNEERLLVQKTIPPDYSEVAKEGIAILAHKDNPIHTFTNEQLFQILSGETLYWNEINSNFNQKQKKIVLVFDNAKSGIIAFLRDSILAGKSFAPDLYALKHSEEVLDYVSKTPNSMGFIGISWISDIDNRDAKAWREKIKLVYLEKNEESMNCTDKRQFFGPFQSFLYQNCYPLTRTIYTIGRESGIGLGTGFVAYLDGPSGQRIFHKSGLAAVHTITREVKFPVKEQNSTTNSGEQTNTKKENDTPADKK